MVKDGPVRMEGRLVTGRRVVPPAEVAWPRSGCCGDARPRSLSGSCRFSVAAFEAGNARVGLESFWPPGCY